MTTGKTIALTRHTFVGKVMSLLFNMLSRLVISNKVVFLASTPVSNFTDLSCGKQNELGLGNYIS